MIGLIVTLILAIIWMYFVAKWALAPKVTCVGGENNTEEKCFNSTREAHQYYRQRNKELKKEEEIYVPDEVLNNTNIYEPEAVLS